jgi:hypothetical protein
VGNIPAPFRYDWLPGSDLVQSLAMPNGVTRQATYDPHRDLLASITHTNTAGTVLTRRTFAYDATGRLANRTQYRLGDETNRLDAFSYNPRSELTSAVLGTNDYVYLFDPIGNRISTTENTETTEYVANELNQYSQISVPSVPSVVNPTYDADGNQTLIRTATGIWHVRYNGENRPVCFSNDTAVVDMDYDYKGRRFTLRVAEWNAPVSQFQVSNFQRHLYRDYLRIAALDMLNTNAVIHTIVWDPAEPVATRPLLLTANDYPLTASYYTYSFDQVKNVTELFDAFGVLAATYEYAPFGAVTQSSGPAAPLNPLTFSSEIGDIMFGLVYYNWRHLNVLDGRWLNHDPSCDVSFYVAMRSTSLPKRSVVGLFRTKGLDLKAIWSVRRQNEEKNDYILKNPANGIDVWGLAWWNPFSWFCCKENDDKEPTVKDVLGGVVGSGMGEILPALGKFLDLAAKVKACKDSNDNCGAWSKNPTDYMECMGCCTAVISLVGSGGLTCATLCHPLIEIGY